MFFDLTDGAGTHILGTEVLPPAANQPAPRNQTLNIMEENNQNDAERQVDAANAQAEEQPAPAETPKAVSGNLRRKNGRNSRANAHSQSKTAENSAVCGEISDISSASEKLSGANVNGYRHERKFRDKSDDNPNGELSETSEPGSEIPQEQQQDQNACEPTRDGPQFEQKKFTPRTFEVGLEDKRPRHFDNNKNQDGVVSYSSAEEAACPPVSLLARIKSMLKSLFGSKKNKKFDKKRKFGNSQKRDFHGKRKFSNSKNFNRDGKNFNHRRHQNRGRYPQQAASKEQ